jgi:glycosyltransferase involved in cell wall biosynthesis
MPGAVRIVTEATKSEQSVATAGAPQVSVLVTTYNHARYVEEALDSLRRQTSGDFEVIITDDASTDGCGDVIAAWLARTGFPARFIRNPVNRGICANRNTELALASGRFVCSLSGDDSYEPDRIARQLAYFLALPGEVGAVYSDMLVVDSEGKLRQPSYLEAASEGRTPPQGDVFDRILAKNVLPGPAVMVRRSAIAEVGGYDETLDYEDFDMWLRLASRFQFAYLPGVLVRHRMLETSLSNAAANRPAFCRSTARILNKWLDAGLDEHSHRLVLHMMLRNGAMQLRARDIAGARETFATVAARDRRPHRRLLARAAMVPGVYLGSNAFVSLYRGWKYTRNRLRRAT